MTDGQVKYMVDRFLGWSLPENFNPDAGISFKPYHGIPPTGTNLFDATQAEAMIRYLVEGMPRAMTNSQDALSCPHIDIVRVLSIPASDGLQPPQDGVFTYYCKACHLTLYVRFTDAPPIVVLRGIPPKGETQ